MDEGADGREKWGGERGEWGNEMSQWRGEGVYICM